MNVLETIAKNLHAKTPAQQEATLAALALLHRKKTSGAVGIITAQQAEAARLDLHTFVRTFWRMVEPDEDNKFVDNWHIREMCKVLMAVTRGDYRRVIFNIPPATSKSVLVSVFWPAWMWASNPRLRFLTASYGTHLTVRDNLRVRDICRSESYQAHYPLRFTGDQNVKELFNTSQRGWRFATSVGGAGTGEHPDFIIIDDPLTASQARSEAEREACRLWFKRTISTRGVVRDVRIVLIMQRLHECLDASSCIMTPMGLVRADEVKAGDTVLTSEGSQHVVAVASRQHEGVMVGIRTYGYPETLRLTPEHPLLTVDGWKPAGAISANDTLVYAVPKGSTSTGQLRLMWPSPPPRHPPKPVQSVTGARGRVKREVLERLVLEGLSSTEIARRLGYRSRVMADAYIAAFGIVRTSGRPVDQSIVEDPDFWRVVGYWLAEGDLTKRRDGEYANVRFTFGAGESRLVADVVRVMKRYGLVPSVMPGPSVLTVFFGSWQMASFLRLFGVGASRKHLPEWVVLLPERLLRELVIGYWRGDGCESAFGVGSGGGLARFTSVSLPLLYGFQRALLRLGVVAAIVHGQGPHESTIKSGPRAGGVIRGRNPSFELRVSGGDIPWLGTKATRAPRWRANRLVGDDLHVRIRSVDVEPYTGSVYDIETESHDFLCGLVTAHNCDLSGHLLGMGGWESVMFPMRFEPDRADKRDPRTTAGELLWPAKFNEEAVRQLEIDLDQFGAAGQLQQRPSPEGGGLFKRSWFEVVDDVPQGGTSCRGWDIAATEGGGDWTAGVKIRQIGPTFYVEDVRRGQWSPLETEKEMLHTANVDGKDTRQREEVEPGAAGKTVISARARLLVGYDYGSAPTTGDKIVRARPFRAQCEAGNVKLKRALWNEAYLAELEAFPNGSNDDQVDGSSAAFNELTTGPRAVRTRSVAWG